MQKTVVLVSIICVLISARKINATSVVLTSDVDVGGGYHIAVPNKVVQFTCSVSEASTLTWTVKSSHGEEFISGVEGRYSQGDEVGNESVENYDHFSIELTEKIPLPEKAYNYSSTLTFNVSISDNQLEIRCNNYPIGTFHLTYTLSLNLTLNGTTSRTHTVHSDSTVELTCTANKVSELIWEVVNPDNTNVTIKLNSSYRVLMGHGGNFYYSAKIIPASKDSTTSTLSFVANDTANGTIVKCGDRNNSIATIITVNTDKVPAPIQPQNFSCVFKEADCGVLDMIVHCDWTQSNMSNVTTYNIITISGDYVDEKPGDARAAELKISCNRTANESISLVAVTSLGINSTMTNLTTANDQCLKKCNSFQAPASDGASSPVGPITGTITALLLLVAALILTLYLLATRREEFLSKYNLCGPSKPTNLKLVSIALTEAQVQWSMSYFSPHIEAFTVYVETHRSGEEYRAAVGVVDAIGTLDGVRREVVLKHLVSNQTWRVRVKAWKDGVGAESNPFVFVTPPAPPERPDIVDICRKEGQCQAILTWRQAPDNENRLPTMYHVITRCLDQEAVGTLGNESDPFAEPQIIAGDKNEATIKQIFPHARYFIRVISINGDGESACSETEL